MGRPAVICIGSNSVEHKKLCQLQNLKNSLCNVILKESNIYILGSYVTTLLGCMWIACALYYIGIT